MGKNIFLIYILSFILLCSCAYSFCLPDQPDVYVTSNITCKDQEFSIAGNLHINDTFNLTQINTSIYLNTTTYYVEIITNGLLYLDQNSYLGPGLSIPSPINVIEIVFDINKLKNRDDNSYWWIFLTSAGFIVIFFII